MREQCKISRKKLWRKIFHRKFCILRTFFSRKPKDLKLYLVFFDGISCIFFKFQFFCEIFAFSLKISYFALLVTRLQVQGSGQFDPTPIRSILRPTISGQIQNQFLHLFFNKENSCQIIVRMNALTSGRKPTLTWFFS